MSKPTYSELEKRILNLEQKLNALSSISGIEKNDNLELFFSQSLSGFFFMMLDEPIEWNDSIDKEKVMDYVFAHSRITKVNQAMLDQYGAKEEEFLELTPNDFYAYDLAQGHKVWKDFFDKGRLKVKTNEKRLNGSIFFIEGDYICLYDNQGRIIGHFGIQNDVTEQKAIEKKINENKVFYETMLNSSPDVIYIYDIIKQKIIYSNDGVIRTLGYSASEIKEMGNKLIALLMHPDDFPVYLDTITPQYSTLPDFEFVEHEYRMKHKNGDWRWFHSRESIFLRQENGSPQQIFGILQDITEKRASEKSLKKTQLLLETTFESTNEISILSIDANYKYRFFNSVHKETMKAIYNVDIKTGTNILECITVQSDREKLKKRYEIALSGESKTYIDAFGREKEHYFETLNSPIINEYNEIIGITIFAQDVTDRINTELAIRENEEKYRTLTENLNVGVYRNTAGINGTTIEANPALFKMFGFESKEEYFTRNISESYANTEGRTRFNEKIRINGYVKNEEIIYRKKDGSHFIASESAVAVKDEDGKIQYYDGLIENITDQKEIQDALQRSESFLNEASKISHVGGWEVNLRSNKLVWTEEVYNIYELPFEYEPVVEEVFGYFPPEDFEKISIAYALAIESGEAFDIELKLITKNSNTKWVRAIGKAVFQDGEPVKVLGTFQDISSFKTDQEEKKKLELALFQSQKMESIGRLAGGVAHDFNNILTGIMGYAELLKVKFADSEGIEKQAIDVISTGAERAANLTKQLLGFARQGKYNPEAVDINAEIKEVIEISEKIFEKSIQISYDFGMDVDSVKVDKNQLSQVLTNLIINAKDAMPNGGEIFFKTENVLLDEEYVSKYPEFEAGSYVKVVITDSGTGMTKETLERIFEPFFTTKSEGKGTGLGLATVYGIVKNHGGHINVYSEIGHGTTFNLYFASTPESPQSDLDILNVIRGEGTILVVDDEKHVRKTSEHLLGSFGYRTLFAENGQEALEVYRENQDTIDLVIMDMIMPVMNGKESIKNLVKLYPDVKIILASGYSEEGQAAEILQNGAMAFIQKPFKMHELSVLVSKILHRE